MDGEELVSHVKTMSKAVVDLVKSMTEDTRDVDSANIDAFVEATVRKELEETKQLMFQQRDSITELNDMLIGLRHLFT